MKRTILSLFLGKRVYMHYKPKLEKVMEQMILITEVADLGNAVDDFEFHHRWRSDQKLCSCQAEQVIFRVIKNEEKHIKKKKKKKKKKKHGFDD